MHRWSILIIVQRDATQSSLFIIPQVQSTCFGCQPHPSSGVHKTVTTVSGIGHIFVQLPPSNVAKLGNVGRGSYSDDGCGWHPKHVEWTCRIINRMRCVASRWTVIYMFTDMFRSFLRPQSGCHTWSQAKYNNCTKCITETTVCYS